jgi:osmoprotectant transport system permease protein
MTAGLDPNIADALARLPDYLGQHVMLSVSAILLGLLLGLPLAVAAIRAPRFRVILLAVIGLAQTIPGLALLALFYPLLLGLSLLTTAAFGVQFSALGFLPSLLALTLYSMLPILRNTVTGVLGVDVSIKQAAAGVGMTPMQSLLRVELPIALPTIMAGVRTAAVWVIGTATLSTAVGQTSLGNYIFTGLQTQNWIFVLFGCVAAAILALLVDALLAGIETSLTRRNRRGLALAAAVTILVLAASMLPAFTRDGAQYVIGAKPFAEQHVLAALLQQRLADAGLASTQRAGLGSTVAFDALAAGDIDVYVDYTGTLWTNVMHRTEFTSRDSVLRETAAWLEANRGVTLFGSLGFENAYALAMRRGRAEALGIRTIEDLARHAPAFSIGADVEFFVRPEWRALQQDYGLRFGNERQLQATFMYPAVADGEVEVIAAYSSDGQIAQYDLVLLEDPKQSLPPYDAVILLAPGRAQDRALTGALGALLGAVTVERMREANLMVSGGNGTSPTSPADAARWLSSAIVPQKEKRP